MRVRSNHLVLCHSFLLPPSIFPSIRVNESPGLGDTIPLPVSHHKRGQKQHFSCFSLSLSHIHTFLILSQSLHLLTKASLGFKEDEFYCYSSTEQLITWGQTSHRQTGNARSSCGEEHEPQVAHLPATPARASPRGPLSPASLCPLALGSSARLEKARQLPEVPTHLLTTEVCEPRCESRKREKETILLEESFHTFPHAGRTRRGVDTLADQLISLH